jgi:hypothetical protein
MYVDLHGSFSFPMLKSTKTKCEEVSIIHDKSNPNSLVSQFLPCPGLRQAAESGLGDGPL